MDEIQPIVFTNKVLLEYSHAHLFITLGLQLLSCNNGRVIWLQHKTQSIYLALYKNSFPTTLLEEHPRNIDPLLFDSIQNCGEC